MKFLQNEIKTKKDIAYYVTDLYDNNMMYHFDDDAEDILSNISDFSERAFTDDQCKLLNKRRDEMLAIDYDYAFECALELLCNEDECYTQEHRNSLTQEQINSI